MSLANIKILATGGTIAGSSGSQIDLTEYSAGSIGVQDLIDAVPQITQFANVGGEQICNINSSNITEDVWLKLAKRVNELLAADDTDGVVITHGTDTLEETAYFLNLTVKSSKPVVIVGSMRPATAISADGPLNLLNAVILAASKKAHGLGVLVLLNDEINAAREVTKTNTLCVQTFKTPDLGVLGYMLNAEPVFYRKPVRKHTADSEFSVAGLSQLPYVKAVYGQACDDRVLIDALIAHGAKGIVYAGMGNGNIHYLSEEALVDARQQGIAVVVSSRTGSGIVSETKEKWQQHRFVYSDNLTAPKARILLSLALTTTSDPSEIKRIFAEY